MNLKSVRRARNKIEPKKDSQNESIWGHIANNVIEEESQVIKLKGLNNNKYFL
jgi:hypothetical protein